MKRSVLDKFIGIFSPERETQRISAKIKSEMLLRAYDAAKTFNTDDWTSATKGGPNSEISGAQATLRDKGSDAVRNNPYGTRAVTAIAANVVGSGIVPHIKGRNQRQIRYVMDAWREWGETTLCDSNGKHNFYSMQNLIMRAVVERGEALAIKEIFTDQISLRILESDFIADTINKLSPGSKLGNANGQGITLDERGKVESYSIYKNHPGENFGGYEILEYSADKVCHIYRIDRPGQRRGVSWLHSVIRQLEDLNQYQQATLISRKIGACFSAFITKNDMSAASTAADELASRQKDSMIEPGVMKHLNPGESVTIASPPKIDGYEEFIRQTLRAVASGLGITYEAFTSDYSQVNYSSGRMAHLEFRKNIENWQYSIIIPQFCEPSFKHFLLWCQLVKGIDTDGVSCDWIPQAWSMLDPEKEVTAMTLAMRSGLTSYQKAVRELGYQPEDILEEIAEVNNKLDEYGIKLDSDPRNLTKAGILQIAPAQQTQNGDKASAESNKTDSADSSSSQSN